eukprot:scaffold88715_cov48-Cyclotella_meneghiniana.AAC.2
MKLRLSEDFFTQAAEPIMRRVLGSFDAESTSNQRHWMAFFGAKPIVMVDVWSRSNPEQTMPRGAEPLHLTWMFYFLRQYNTEEVSATNAGGISWEKRKQGDRGYRARTTFDGTDMPVQHHFDPKFMSHKFKSNAVKYEVG